MTHITPPTADASDGPLVLVLPFESHSGEEGRHLAEGVSDELAFALTRLASLRVIGRGTAEWLRGKGTPAECGEEVGASFVIAGTVTTDVAAPGAVSTSAVTGGSAAPPLEVGALQVEIMLATVGGESHDARHLVTLRLAEFTAGIAELAASVARYCAVDAPMRWREQVARPLASGADVTDLFLRGRHHLEQRPIGVKLAMQCFDRAIRLDGTVAVAYGALGILWANFGIFLALPPSQARERALAQAERALALDAREANALAALLTVATFYDWDLARADELGGQLLDEFPSWVTPRQVLLYAHAVRGDGAAVRALARQVQRLEPRAVDPVNDVGYALLLIGAADEAATLLADHAALHPGASEVHRRLGLALLEGGRSAQAVEALERSVTLSRRHVWGVANLACACARAGRDADARRLLAELAERADGELVPAIAIAQVHASLGEGDLAMAALERALDARDYWLLAIDRDPLLDPLRADPRFPAFRARCTPILH